MSLLTEVKMKVLWTETLRGLGNCDSPGSQCVQARRDKQGCS